MKQTTLNLIKNINENTFIPANTKNELFELFQLDTVADLRKVSRNFMKIYELLEHFDSQTSNATTEKEGIVKFGMDSGSAVDAGTWRQAIGQMLGGYISKVRNKEAGKWYINDLTDGKIYKCIQNHTSASFDITKFVDITNVGLSDKVENLYEKRAGFTRVGQTLIQWGYIENPSTNATLNYPVPFKEGTLPIVTIANWVNTDLIVLTTQNNRFCSFKSSKAISLNWIVVGLAT